MAKTSTVISDDINGTTDPKAIPWATIEYCILITNTGTSTLSNIAATENLPAGFTYLPGTMTSGTSCANATTTEDDNNLDADESDPFGASVNGTTLTVTCPPLAPSI